MNFCSFSKHFQLFFEVIRIDKKNSITFLFLSTFILKQMKTKISYFFFPSQDMFQVSSYFMKIYLVKMVRNRNIKVLIRRNLVPTLLLVIITMLITNHLKIVMYIRKSSHRRHCAESNETINYDYIQDPDYTVKFPHVFNGIEHLSQKKSDYFRPDIFMSRNRKATFVIGVPTIKRKDISYLNTMLDSLFLALNPQEKEQTLVVILLAEVFWLLTQFKI